MGGDQERFFHENFPLVSVIPEGRLDPPTKLMKFNLTVNDQQSEGFKLVVQAENEKELAVVTELTLKLIEKIEKISVEVKNYE